MAEIMSLGDAVAHCISSGDLISMEGFTHLIPHGVAHEIIRQGIGDLQLVRLTPDLLSDQLIGCGLVSKLIFSWGGNPGVGSLHRFRDAIEHGWPKPLEIEEHSHAGLTNRYVAGASGLPFALLRGYAGTGLPEVNRSIRFVQCPFTRGSIAAVPALNPDVSVIHAQQADTSGNVQLWGITGVQKEAVLAGRKAIVSVEEVVDKLELRPGGIILPSWVITAVVEVPGGAFPSYAAGYTSRNNAFYEEWDDISRKRESFELWIDEYVRKAVLQ